VLKDVSEIQFTSLLNTESKDSNGDHSIQAFPRKDSMLSSVQEQSPLDAMDRRTISTIRQKPDKGSETS
jgi:hypothetical protein